MNHTSKRALQLTAMILVGATIFMGGCGPDNLDDPTYIAEYENSDAAADATTTQAMTDDGQAQGTDGKMRDNQPNAQGAENQGDGQEMPQGGAAAMGSQPMVEGEGQPVPAGSPVAVAAVVPPARVVQLPDAFVKLPSEFRAQPPVVTHSGEQINFQRRILHQRDIHVAQPAVEEHLITKNVHTHNQFQTNIINHPSFRKNVAFAHSASVSSEVLPTTVVTAPAVVAPGFVHPIVPAVPYCAPWFSGGLLRACGPIHR